MARLNERGLELSFKAYGNAFGGRWYKTIDGQPIYFGKGSDVRDKDSYKLAVAKFQQYLKEVQEAEAQAKALAALASVLNVRNGSLEQVAGQLRSAMPAIASAASQERLGQLQRELDASDQLILAKDAAIQTFEKVRNHQPLPATEIEKGDTVSGLLDLFLADQRKRMIKREHIERLQATGKDIKEPMKANIGAGRFGAIERDVKSFRACVGKEPWDGTEATAAKIVRSYRNASELLLTQGKHTPNTLNDRIKLARQFCGWCETNYHLDRLPRDKTLFSKYTYTPEPKSIPLDVLFKLYDGATEVERCWLLIGLNAAYYAQDLNDLSVQMVSEGYLDHSRSKTSVNVKYKLWNETKKVLKGLLPASGPVFLTEDGTPLVHYRPGRKDKAKRLRIDNVRNHFYRLCEAVGVPTGKDGYSFSNIRDTAATEAERINPAFTDLFLAHADKRMARYYVDGQMTDTSGLDGVIDKLEEVFKPIWDLKARKVWQEKNKK